MSESLVAKFYAALDGHAGHRPTRADLGHAAALIAEYGPEVADAIAGKLADHVKRRKKRLGLDVKYPGGAVRFVAEVAAELERARRETHAPPGDPWTRWTRTWAELPEEERAAFRREVVGGKPRFREASPATVEEACVTAWGQMADARVLART